MKTECYRTWEDGLAAEGAEIRPAVLESVHEIEILSQEVGMRQEAAANQAKSGCPISRLLNTKITMDARLES